VRNALFCLVAIIAVGCGSSSQPIQNQSASARQVARLVSGDGQPQWRGIDTDRPYLEQIKVLTLFPAYQTMGFWGESFEDREAIGRQVLAHHRKDNPRLTSVSIYRAEGSNFVRVAEFTDGWVKYEEIPKLAVDRLLWDGHSPKKAD
jgi:hypothetical protein